jgi:hypothetical protein
LREGLPSLAGRGEPSVPCAVVTLRRVPLISSRCASLRPSAFLPLPSVLPIRLPQRPSEEGARGRDCHWPSRVWRLQAGDRGGVRKPASASRGRYPAPGPGCSPKRASRRAGDCHRDRPAEAGVAQWGSPLGVGRSRFRGGVGRSLCHEGDRGTLSGGSRSCRDIGAGWRGPPKRASYPVTGLPRRQAGDATSKLVTGGPGGRCAAPASRCRHRPGRSREGGEPPSDFPGQGDSRHLRREAGAEGPSPKTSVRLRSACADPHITEGSLGDGVRRSPAEAGEVLPIVRSGVDGGLSLHPLPGSAINCPPEGAADFKALLR